MALRKTSAREKLDPNMVKLVRALNAFEGIQTHGSCGGHRNPTPAQWDEGTFYVKFRVAWDQHGQFALEFLAWFINSYMVSKTSGRVRLLPVSAPPYLNEPGKCLSFAIEGCNGADPVAIGRELQDARKKCFIPPAALDAN